MIPPDDEDDLDQDSRVLTIGVQPSQRGHVVDTPPTHDSLARLYDEMLGVPLLYRRGPELQSACERTLCDVAHAIGGPPEHEAPSN